MRFHEKLLLALAASAAMIIANPIDTQAAEQARVTDNLPRYHTIGASSRFHRRAEREITPKMISKSFGKGPEACDDFLNPSQECQKAIEASMQKDEKDGDNLVGIAGGKLKYAWSSGCEAHYKKIERAAYDAWDLSDTAIEDVSDPDLTPIWNTWMGPDHTDYKGRIIGNLGRISDFKQNKKYDIYIHCDDPRQWCIKKYGDQTLRVGGYAYTYENWLGWKYISINLCEPFLKLETLNEKVSIIDDRVRHGDMKWATNAVWQKNMGQYFLHEMMHLNQTSGDSPHITDEVVNPYDNSIPAYGPDNVYRMARRPKEIPGGGGASKASTNADSYAWFANSVYFYKLFGKYPLPDAYKGTSVGEEPSVTQDPEDLNPIMVHVGDFNGDDEISSQAADAMFDKAIQGFLKDPKDLNQDDELDPNKKINPPKPPQCDKSDGKGIPEDQATAMIEDFCNNIEQWGNTRIVPLIGYGTGNTKKNGKGKSKALGVYREGPSVDGTKGKLWTGVTFAQEDCMGHFTVSSKKPDEDKAECKAHLQTILSGCGGAGGSLKVTCASWYLKLSEKKPSDQHWKDKGDVKCKDTCSKDDKECREILGDGPAADACTCFYEKYDTITAQFNRPDSGKCDAKDVKLGDLFGE